MLIRYKNILDELNKNGIFQFGSYISGSQYLKAYNLVNKYCQEGSHFLDWGSGSGHFSYFLLSQGYDVTAFTIEKEITLAKNLQTSFPDKYKILIGRDPKSSLPFDDQTFDTVVSIGVLEHVRETGYTEINSLNEIRRVLKLNGTFICYHFPNKYSWIEAVTKHIDSKHHHDFKYTHKDIKSLTGSCNLQLLEYGRYGILPRHTFRITSNNQFLTKFFNMADVSLSVLLNPFCQNYYFVAKRTY